MLTASGLLRSLTPIALRSSGLAKQATPPTEGFDNAGRIIDQAAGFDPYEQGIPQRGSEALARAEA